MNATDSHFWGAWGSGPALRVTSEGASRGDDGRRVEAPTITWTQRGSAHQEILTFILPVGSEVEAVEEIPGVGGGRGFALHRRSGKDLLLVRDTAPVVEAPGVHTDADWLWLHRDASGRIGEYVAIGADSAPSFTTS